MKRREFLGSSMAVAAGSLIPKSASAQTERIFNHPRRKGVQILFEGLNLFVIPRDKEQRQVDVAFVNTRLNASVAAHVHPHVPTLKIAKGFVEKTSTAIPAASDDIYAYYALLGQVRMVATTTNAPSDGKSEKPTLKWKDDELNERNPEVCPTGKAWNNLRWLLDPGDLYKSVRLPPDWRKSEAFSGILTLATGHLEDDEVPLDPRERYRYTLTRPDRKPEQRLLKDLVRCYIPEESGYLQFVFETSPRSTSLVIPCSPPRRMAGVEIYHLPTPGMHPEHDGPLTDYWAAAEALVEPMELRTFKDVSERPTLTNRTSACPDDFTARTGACAGMRLLTE